MKTKQGIVKTVILIIIALLILSYYGFDLKQTVESPTTQSNFSYATKFVVNVWHTYLERPAKYIWNEIFLKLIWHSAVTNLENINNNQPMEMQQQAPQLPVPSNS
jgi:hypothetical protein